MVFDSKAFFDTLFSSIFIVPALTTLAITLVAMALAMLLGFGGALAALSRYRALRWLVQGYLGFFRGVPVLVQIVFWYNALPVLTNNAINLPALVAGTMALALNEGAYMTEIIRSGLLSVDPGQREAARALGMTKPMAMRRIVLPQALQGDHSAHRQPVHRHAEDHIAALRHRGAGNLLHRHQHLQPEFQIFRSAVRGQHLVSGADGAADRDSENDRAPFWRRSAQIQASLPPTARFAGEHG